MANFTDDFNRADSTNLGTDWTEVTSDLKILNNYLCNVTATSDTSFICYVDTHSPASADYSVQADVLIVSGGNGASPGVIGRYTDSTHFYMVRSNAQDNAHQLYVFNAGATHLASYGTVAKDTTYTIKLEMIGSAIKGYINGVERMSVTNSALTSAGQAGVRSFINNSGSNFEDLFRWDNFSATDIGGSSASSSVSLSISPSPSASVSPSSSISPSPSLSISLSPSASVSPSSSISLSPSVSVSLSPSLSVSLSPSASVSPSSSISLSPSVSVSLSLSLSPSVSVSVSLSPSLSISLSPSLSPSSSVSLSPSVSVSLSPSLSPSVSVSLSPSLSPSVSASLSPSLSPSISPSVSVSSSPSVTESSSISLSPSTSESRSPSTSFEPQTLSIDLYKVMFITSYNDKYSRRNNSYVPKYL